MAPIHKTPVASFDRLLNLCRRLRHADAHTIVSALLNRAWPARSSLSPAIVAAVQDRRGLEIGGPSRVFMAGQLLPAYAHAACIDNVNFSSRTAWESNLLDGGEFLFSDSKPAGRQFLREATALHGIADNTYDFLLSSHCLEHTANPLAALHEWKRVVRPGGYIVLLLPDPRHCFDHRRPVTTLAHLKSDFDRQMGEDDLTHLDEILALHDLKRDFAAGTKEQFRERGLLNQTNRCLHHHVFDLSLQCAALEESGWIVTASERTRPLHLIALARKPGIP